MNMEKLEITLMIATIVLAVVNAVIADKGQKYGWACSAVLGINILLRII